MSLGHFSTASTPNSAATSVNASPATMASEPSDAGGTSAGRNNTLRYTPLPAGEAQVRPLRPTPAVCSSASNTVRSEAPSAARTRRSALVDPVRETTSIAA